MNNSDNTRRKDDEDQIVRSVRDKLLSRSQAGIAKYGTKLDRTDLTRLQWLVHAQEEALDLANYLEVLIQQESREVTDAIEQKIRKGDY